MTPPPRRRPTWRPRWRHCRGMHRRHQWNGGTARLGCGVVAAELRVPWGRKTLGGGPPLRAR